MKHIILLCTLVTALAAQTPLNLTISDAPKNLVTQNATQIELIKHPVSTALKPITLEKPFGPDYTLSLWVKLNPNPAYAETKFTPNTPPTIAELHSAKIDEQRVSIRVKNNLFSAAEIIGNNPVKWRDLSGLGMKAEPNKWYHLAYTHSPAGSILYINGDIALRSTTPSPQDKLQTLLLGHFQGSKPMRKFDGDIAQPRLYPEALDAGQIRTLSQTPPAK